MDRPSSTRSVPAFSPRDFTALYVRGRHDELSEQFLAVLRHFRDTSYHTLDGQGRRFVNAFAKLFLTLFTEPDYAPGRKHLFEFVRFNPTISNVVALSSFRTTEPFLEQLGGGPADFGKLLALCSARNSAALDRKSFFDADPVLACAWYSAYAELYRTGLLDPVIWNNLRDHFAFEDDRLDVRRLPTISYFASTYVGDGRDRVVRTALNRSFQKAAGALRVANVPDRRKIAVVTGNWSPVHSAYRITKAFVEALEGYHLTLVTFGTRRDLDPSLFQKVMLLPVDGEGVVDVRPLLDNDFMVAYYPDVGLTPQSMLLTNLRLAPVQIASLGHSVSTWGAKIDYFISGALVEPATNPERNYSERLVLLPGCGAVHESPNYTPSGRRKQCDEFVLNGSWNAQKLNHPFGQVLAELIKRLTKPVRLRLFVGASLNRQNDYLPFLRDLRGLLGPANVEIVRELPYREYMSLLEEGDLGIDSYPFGGCNTVADSLYLRKPIVCREGDVWYNRIGPAMLRMVGLPELIASTGEEFVEIALRLIHDDEFRAGLQQRLDRADLAATIFNRSEARSFRRAVDYLVENREQLRQDPDHSPIHIAD